MHCLNKGADIDFMVRCGIIISNTRGVGTLNDRILFMIKIAIVEDEKQAYDTLNGYIQRYFSDVNQEYSVTWFDKSVAFLSDYKAIYDIVFMDIELPDLNGMEAAEKMRENDSRTVLIFVTNMAQYAIRGYDVDALSYILKPVKYPSFVRKMDKALQLILQNADKTINISQNGVLTRIALHDLKYVEVEKHSLIYHTEKDILCWGSLKKAEEELAPYNFFRPNNYCLVNVRYVAKIEDYTVTLNDGTRLQISRPRKQKFMKDVAAYFGKGGKNFNA